MIVKAISKNIRISPSKVKLILDEIKILKPHEAVKMLELTHKSAAIPVRKVILSAMANAKNNNNFSESSLKFSTLQVGPAATMKRYRATSRGRPHTIFKRTSNIRIELLGKVAESKSSESKNLSKKGAEKNGSKS